MKAGELFELAGVRSWRKWVLYYAVAVAMFVAAVAFLVVHSA